MTHVSSHWHRRLAAGIAATAILGTMVMGAGVAAAAPGDPGVPITVVIEDVETGALSMTVAPGTVALAENGSDTVNRKFTGTLPTVTVTDTRSNVPENKWWAVVGQTDDFVEGADPAKMIPGDYLGWAPELVSVPVGDDQVSAGPEIDSIALPDGDGLAEGFELLVSSWTSDGAAEFGTEWKAAADLALVVPADELEPGSYAATLTLSLFEDDV